MTVARRLPFAAVVALLAVYLALALSASVRQGPTFDETAHLTAGYNAWLNQDFRFDPGNGDFAKRWATLPLLLSRPVFPPRRGDAWQHAEFFTVGHDLLFRMGNAPEAMLLACRAMIAVLGAGLGLIVFWIARDLFGPWAGLLSLGAYVFTPQFLAHGALVSSDLTLALAFLASVWTLWRLLHEVTWARLAASLAALAVLLLSKMSAVLLGPIALVLVIVRLTSPAPWPWRLGGEPLVAGRGRQLRRMAALALLHLVVGWAAIWACYDFRYLARADAADTALTLVRPATGVVESRPGLATSILAVCRDHHLLPEGYLAGMAGIAGISDRRPSFMDGHWKAGGRPAFFPYAFWVKTSPALLALLLLAGLRRHSRRVWYEATPLLALFVIYGTAALAQQVNIGDRHILALYPLLCIAAGGAVAGRGRLHRFRTALAAVLAVWLAADSLAVYPHYLAYFSPVAGGPSAGYRHLVDSSLDWGQDLPGLADWLARTDPRGVVPVHFSYFGTGDPDYYGIRSDRLPGFPDWRDLAVSACTPGYYAISATLFQNLYTQPFGPWNRKFETEYQSLIFALGLTRETMTDSDRLTAALLEHPDSYWQEKYSRFEKLRFNRLCAWLRRTGRPPDAEVGYSILIWRLTAADLAQALWSGPVELYDRPAAELPDGI